MRSPLLHLSVCATLLVAALPGGARAERRDPVPARIARIERDGARRTERCHRRAAARELRGHPTELETCIVAVRARRRAALRSILPPASPALHPRPLDASPGEGEIGRGLAWLPEGAARVPYELSAGRAVFQGDILLGARPGEPTVAGEAAGPISSPPAGTGAAGDSRLERPQSLTVRDWNATWLAAQVPYEIDSSIPAPLRLAIGVAVAHWNENTLLRLRPRESGDLDYLVFRRHPTAPNVGSSYIGRIRGPQEVLLGETVPAGVVIHEIGHATGLLHEQGRADRDEYVLVHWENIDPTYRGAFEKTDPTYAIARGPYDFGSIMHYWDGAFSRNGQPTLTRLDGSPLRTQGDSLSDLDIAGFTRLQIRGPAKALASQATGRCLDITGARIARGVPAVARPCRIGGRQRWVLHPDARSGATLLVNRRSGMCLAVPGGTGLIGARLVQAPCHGGPSQQFDVSSVGAVTLRSRASGLCAEATPGAGDAPDRIVQKHCSGSPAQRWNAS